MKKKSVEIQKTLGFFLWIDSLLFTQHFVIMTESYIIIIIVAKVRLLLTMILADIFPGSIKIMGVVFRFSKQQKFFDNGLHPHIISVTEILSILMDYWHFKTTERESFIFFFIEKKNSTVSKKFGS